MRRILELVIMTSIMTIVYKLIGFEFVVITVLAQIQNL